MPSHANPTFSPFRQAFLSHLPRSQAAALAAVGADLWEALAFSQPPADQVGVRRDLAHVLADLLMATRQLCEFGEFLDDRTSPAEVPLLSAAVRCADQVLTATEPLRIALAPTATERLREEMVQGAQEVSALIARLEAANSTLGAPCRHEEELSGRVALIVTQRLHPALVDLQEGGRRSGKPPANESNESNAPPSETP